MSDQSPLPRLRLFENSPGQQHIQDRDRYLFAPPMANYRIGIIGTGTMGQEHMRVAGLIGRAQVHGVYDAQDASVDAALAAWPHSGGPLPQRYDTLEAMVADEQLNALFICTPNHTHLSVLREVAASGKPIFLEKPMATSLEDGRELAALAEEHPAFIQLGLQYRYKAPYVEAWNEIRERGAIGDIKTVSMSEYRPPFLDKVGQWNKFAANTGGTLVEKCCHYFDLMGRFANGKARRVYASGGQAVNFRDFNYKGQTADIDDHAFVIIDYDNGVRGNFTLNMFSPVFREELVIVGDGGRLTARESFDPQRDSQSTSTVGVETHEPAIARESTVSYGSAIEGSGHHGATYHEHLAFLDQLDGGESEAATVRDGLWSMVVAIAAQQSMASGDAVFVDDLIERHRLTSYLYS